MSEIDWVAERDAAEQRFRVIHEECKGRPIKSLMATPAAMRALRDLWVAAVKANS